MLTRQELQLRIKRAKTECGARMKAMSYPTTGVYCNRTWDDILCWDDTRAGVTSNQTCPEFIFGSGHSSLAFRHCREDGSWFFNHFSNNTWTNYSACSRAFQESPFPIIEKHLPHIRRMYNIGYGLSLVSLLVAMIIMIVCRLRSKSNTLHMNLFAAFVMRASISFLKENLLVDGLSLESDIIVDEHGEKTLTNGTGSWRRDLQFSSIEKRPGCQSLWIFFTSTLIKPIQISHWQCKLMFSSFQYSITLTHIWIFVEGLYLHTLIYQTFWVERHGIRPFVLVGWTLPVLIVVPWVVMRATTEDKLCWNTTESGSVYWILRGPVVVTVIINFGLFLNILRMLVSRARSSHRQMNAKYRKMAKFIGALIPLFGIIYILFLAVPHTLNEKLDIVYLYAEMFCNSIQGFVLALLFCFLNEEVHTELRRMWARHRSRWAASNNTRIPLKKVSRLRSNNIESSMGVTYQESLSTNGMRSSFRQPSPEMVLINTDSPSAEIFL